MSVNAKAVLKSIETAGLYDEGGHHKTQLTLNVTYVGDNSTSYDGQPTVVIDLENALLTILAVNTAIRDAIITYGDEQYDFVVDTTKILAFNVNIL